MKLDSVPVRVFVHYVHQDATHDGRVKNLVDDLRANGIDARFDRHIGGTPSEGWPRWIEDQIAAASRVLLVAAKTDQRLQANTTISEQGVAWESSIIRQEMLDKSKEGADARKFAVVSFSEASKFREPPALEPYLHYRYPQERTALLRWLTDQPAYAARPLGRVLPLLFDEDDSRFSLFLDRVKRSGHPSDERSASMRSAFEVLLREVGSRMAEQASRTARRYKVDAEDLYQETVIRLYRRWDQHFPQVAGASEPQAEFLHLARKALRVRAREMAKHARTIAKWEGDSTGRQVTAVELQVPQADEPVNTLSLYEAISKLTPEDAAVVQLTLAGHSTAEIARELWLPPPEAERRLKEATDLVRDVLEEVRLPFIAQLGLVETSSKLAWARWNVWQLNTVIARTTSSVADCTARMEMALAAEALAAGAEQMSQTNQSLATLQQRIADFRVALESKLQEGW